MTPREKKLINKAASICLQEDAHLWKEIERLFDKLLPKHRGGYVAIVCDDWPQIPILVKQVGQAGSDSPQHFADSIEVATALLLDSEAVASSLVASIAEKKPSAGAIKVGHYAFAFGGLPPDASEAIVLWLLNLAFWSYYGVSFHPSGGWLEKVAETTQNPYFRKL